MNRSEEISAKRKLIRGRMAELGIGGVVISGQAAFSWYTAGGENRVVTASEEGVASIVATPEQDYIVTNNIEGPRVSAEAVPAQSGFQILESPWYEPGKVAEKIAELASGRSFVTDGGPWDLPALPEGIIELSYQLMEPEIERYRDVGREASFAVEGACHRAEPGMTEEEVAAVVAEEVYARGLVPTLILVASDERTEKFRHPLPTGKRIDNSLMVVLCARRHGLIASLTRLVYFGRALPTELAAKHRAVQQVDAAFILATTEGTPVEEIFEHGLTSYDANGYRDEWQNHHQGGPTGYQGRSYKARRGEKRKVLAPQAYAWNPSIAGTKSEDTVLTVPGGAAPELLTPPLDWPVREMEWGGGTIPRAEILLL
jgi:Metallopeptidase family M24